ncbi:fusaric acid resistance -like family protein [[Clostridium] bifermentans ATCC 19299]|uniref:FUSC family protein n=1 Tax=Paraclostridium bifermentans TaxID=1490 RepID=UPI00038C68FB|nr:FUSC family protein [Paraclostridium bifermentans]EQK44021.1 fusaric acid resistance -like family protein [[Clostridium] bifermentans ATCC 19299] [Paraclostridium bifermentans ATCC 19299]
MKSIISKTIIFIGMIPTAFFFKEFFGMDNMLIGITGFMAAINLIDNDYTVNPIKNTIKFIIIELSIGACAFIAVISPILTLISTFVIVFAVVYIFTYDTTKPIYMPFVLGYLFMIYFPIKSSIIHVRIEALILSALLIMFVQLIANKNKFWNKSKQQLCKDIGLIVDEIDILIDKESFDDFKKISFTLDNDLKNLSQSLYSRKEKTFLISDTSRLYLCITQTLDGANSILEKMVDDKNNIKTNTNDLKDLKCLLLDVLRFLNKEINLIDLKTKVYTYIYKSKKNECDNYIGYELKQNMTLLDDILKNIINGGLSPSDKKYGVPGKVKDIEVIKKRFNRNSLRFTFAFRIALCVSLGAFIVSYFKLYEGKWLVFTLASVIQPYIESSESKMIDRIKGTLIGVFIFELTFHIVKNVDAKMFLAFVCGYISNYFKDYSKRMTFMTIFALGIGSTHNNFNILSFDRIKFILIGCILAFIATRVIFPYKIKDVTFNLVSSSLDLNKKIVNLLKELKFKDLYQSKIDSYNLRELVLTNRLTNDKISINNNTIRYDEINKFLYSERVIMSNLILLKNSISNDRVKSLDIGATSIKMQMYTDGKLGKSDMLKELYSIDNLDDKLIFMNIYEIFNNLKIAQNFSKLVCEN